MGVSIKKNNKVKISFWKRIAETNLYTILEEMGYSNMDIVKYQKRRFTMAFMVTAMCFYAGATLFQWAYFIGIIIAPIYWKSEYDKISRKYSMFRFKREMEFIKFIRLLIPYLKQANGRSSLYSILGRINDRMEHETDQKSLSRLMREMTNRPDDKQPFIDFAKRSSNNKRAIIFMTTIYHYRQSTFDISVINELGQEASDQLMESIREIRRSKMSRLAKYPMLLVYPLLITLIGFAITMVMDSWQTFGF